MKKTSFTLAEVLITLVILGVLSAMVIPSIINNVQNEKLVVSLKKSYATISQVTQQIANDNGGTIKGLCSDADCIIDLYSNYTKVQKKCASGASLGICWHPTSGDKAVRHLDGTVATWSSTKPAFIISNGTMIRVYDAYIDCDLSVGGYSNVCGTMVLDVNGFAPPNVMGRDVFWFNILESRIVPNKGTCIPSSSNDGGCASKVLIEGAMNY